MFRAGAKLGEGQRMGICRRTWREEELSTKKSGSLPEDLVPPTLDQSWALCLQSCALGSMFLARAAGRSSGTV